MVSFALKTILAVALVSCVITQDIYVPPTAPTTTATTAAPAAPRTFPNPDPSWTEYQVKSCCPRGFS